MKNQRQKERARTLAEIYAPRPQSSAMMYGIVATSLASVALVIFSRFYGLDAFAHLRWIIVAAVMIFFTSMVMQLHMARRHATAHQSEYDKMGELR